MASRLLSIDEVVASMHDMMAIPGPTEDDEWSDDEFDGYVESDADSEQIEQAPGESVGVGEPDMRRVLI